MGRLTVVAKEIAAVLFFLAFVVLFFGVCILWPLVAALKVLLGGRLP